MQQLQQLNRPSRCRVHRRQSWPGGSPSDSVWATARLRGTKAAGQQMAKAAPKTTASFTTPSAASWSMLMVRQACICQNRAALSCMRMRSCAAAVSAGPVIWPLHLCTSSFPWGVLLQHIRVLRIAAGRVAAGVSSGGIAMKADGRVGEAACFGAGCYAETPGVGDRCFP